MARNPWHFTDTEPRRCCRECDQRFDEAASALEHECPECVDLDAADTVCIACCNMLGVHEGRLCGECPATVHAFHDDGIAATPAASGTTPPAGRPPDKPASANESPSEAGASAQSEAA